MQKKCVLFPPQKGRLSITGGRITLPPVAETGTPQIKCFPLYLFVPDISFNVLLIITTQPDPSSLTFARVSWSD